MTDYTASLVVSPDDFRLVDGRYKHDEALESKVWSRAFGAWRALLGMPLVSHAVLVCGAPGSGKTTIAAKISERYRHATRRPAVFDATLSRSATRQRLVAVASERGKAAYAVVMSTSLEECLRRNSVRRASRYVDPRKIEAIYRELVAEPPSIADGLISVEYR